MLHFQNCWCQTFACRITCVILTFGQSMEDFVRSLCQDFLSKAPSCLAFFSSSLQPFKALKLQGATRWHFDNSNGAFLPVKPNGTQNLLETRLSVQRGCSKDLKNCNVLFWGIASECVLATHRLRPSAACQDRHKKVENEMRTACFNNRDKKAQRVPSRMCFSWQKKVKNVTLKLCWNRHEKVQNLTQKIKRKRGS